MSHRAVAGPDDSTVWPTKMSSAPFVSVILPVYNGTSTLERAVRSVVGQTLADWELLAVDDGSTDGTFAALQAWAARDARIRVIHAREGDSPVFADTKTGTVPVIRLDENSGPSAARNAALRQARGEFVAYLDQDDEYFGDYLAQIIRLRDAGDVLVFGYDLVYDDAVPPGVPTVWEPRRMSGNLFAMPIVAPLGVAHRRRLLEKVSGFNELLWRDEDWDLWKRLARAGAEFIFVSGKSGRCHMRVRREVVPGDSGDAGGRDARAPRSDGRDTRAPRSDGRDARAPTARQREIVEWNWRAGKPLFGNRPPGSKVQPVQKIVFAAPHFLWDFMSGAAVATAQAMEFLATLGFQCRAFCGSRLDAAEETAVEAMLDRQQIRHETRASRIGGFDARMIHAARGNVSATIFRMATSRGRWTGDEEATAFYRTWGAYLDADRPDAMLTYGGDPVAQTMISLTKNRDIPVVFGLHNFAYTDPAAFQSVDYVAVPSEFARQHYWANLGLACHLLPCVMDWQRVQALRREPRYVTFVNPQPLKGMYVFVRIAEALARRRPDIRLLVVKGRGSADWLEQIGIEPGQLGNLTQMEATPDPGEFFGVTRLLLMPSLLENVGLTAMEAMINGIPVLASNRGALPETIGDAGFLFDIPTAYTPQTRTLPTAEEVEPWVDAIIRLWDDPQAYQQASDAARQRAECWRPENLAPLYRDFFANLFPQPGPPLVPKEVVS